MTSTAPGILCHLQGHAAAGSAGTHQIAQHLRSAGKSWVNGVKNGVYRGFS